MLKRMGNRFCLDDINLAGCVLRLPVNAFPMNIGILGREVVLPFTVSEEGSDRFIIVISTALPLEA